MVFCCVPLCGVDSWKCDPAITFHTFPSNPALSSKWIQQINSAVKSKQKPMWHPRERQVICSRHFLQTDFKDDSDILKPNTIPTIFGYRYIGVKSNDSVQEHTNEATSSPLIVKVNRPEMAPNTSELKISDVFSQAPQFENSAKTPNDTPQTVSALLPSPDKDPSDKNQFVEQLQTRNNNLSARLKETLKALTTKQPPTKKSATAKPKIERKKNSAQKKNRNQKNDLIEIGPNTFLKINPDVIKVNKKQTPSGNTVLQFLMDQKVAKSQNGGLISNSVQSTSASAVLGENSDVPNLVSNSQNSSSNVQKVVGHLIDTHMCNQSGDSDGHVTEDDSIMRDEEEIEELVRVIPSPSKSNNTYNKSSQGGPSFLFPTQVTNAPVLFSTTATTVQCVTEKLKQKAVLRSKSRQIAQLKMKITNLTKKIEDLEDRCIVQERQLSYSFIKRLKQIRKNANRGDPTAVYILEQIRCYAGKAKMRWSDSTLKQCAIWCKKAPYAYEYYNKAGFLKLPCLGTVKRFMRKHPEMNFNQPKHYSNPEMDSDTSSDFTFESNSEEENEVSEEENEVSTPAVQNQTVQSLQNSHLQSSAVPNTNGPSLQATSSNPPSQIAASQSPRAQQSEMDAVTIPMDMSNLELQELILPNGEVVQCYASSLTDGSNQYYIIPNMDQNIGEQEYDVIQTTDSMPTYVDGQLETQQEQLILITNSSEQVECSETEVVTVSST